MSKVLYIYYLAIVLLLMGLVAPLYGNHTADVAIKKEGAKIFIRINPLLHLQYIDIEFKSSRNQNISNYHQISRYDPLFEQKYREIESHDWNIFYPVVDIKPKERMNAVVIFRNIEDAAYSINGMFFKDKYDLASDTLIINSAYLFEWENSIYIENVGIAQMTEFSLKDRVKLSNQKTELCYELLSADWQGEIIVYLDSAKGRIIYREEIGSSEIDSFEYSVLRDYQGPGINKERLYESLKSSIDFTLNSQNHSENDPTKGGLNLFYDYETKSFRRSAWPWSWGPSIKMLLECSDIPEITVDIPKDSLLKVALEIGDASLKFQNMDKDSPAYGVATSRWSETKNMGDLQYDYEQFYSVADGQFLAGWGWMPLYTHTGDKRFLEAARLQTQATERLMEEMGEIPMDYMKNLATWKDYMISEQGFGLEGINELYRVEPEVAYRQIGKDYLEMLLAKLDHQSGGWNRAWVISTQQAKEPFFYVRGHGWAMEGLTAGYELTKDTSYLAKAEKMADLLMKHQLPDGSWSVIFTQEDDNEISDKGTALWSLLFYRMYRFTQNEVYLQTARKALSWCLNNQYFGEDVLAYGSIPNVSRASGVIYRSWFPLACNYTTGFFGLAVLEELTLQNDSEK